MNIYVYEIRDTSNGDETDFSLYETYKDAMDQAIADVVDYMVSYGYDDPSNLPEAFTLYNEVIEHIQNGDFESALEKYHELPDVTNDYEFVYLSVSMMSVIMENTKTLSEHIKLPKESIQPMNKVRQEFSCCHCGRMNDVGVNECWHCGNSV